jgi:hypothetical protein
MRYIKKYETFIDKKGFSYKNLSHSEIKQKMQERI